jgi:WD40 repeat protein
MVVCGSGEGSLEFFKWGDFGDISDRFPGHPGSIDSLLVTDEMDVIVTGCSDGRIRVVKLFEHKLRSVIGKHGNLPIEKLSYTFDKECIVSASHDSVIKFWESGLGGTSNDDDESNDEDEEESTSEEDGDDDENQEEEEDSDDNGEPQNDKDDENDSDSDSDEDERPAKRAKTKKGQTAGGFRAASKAMDSKSFFSDI